MQATWSDDGTLIYAPGSDLGQGEFVWLDRDGGREALGLPPGSYDKFELSPDGSFLAVPIRDGATRDIWIYEIGRDVPQRLTLSGAESFPVWDRGGTSIYFQSQRPEGTGIYKLAVGGANEDPIEMVAPAPKIGRPYGETERGLFFDRAGDVDLLVGQEEGRFSEGPVIEPVLDGEFQEAFPSLSPDGEWLAYMSDETGQWQIYVVSYPDQQTKRLVSTTGGEEPRWSPDGSEIIYRYGSQWFAVSFLDDPELELGLPGAAVRGALHQHPRLFVGHLTGRRSFSPGREPWAERAAHRAGRDHELLRRDRAKRVGGPVGARRRAPAETGPKGCGTQGALEEPTRPPPAPPGSMHSWARARAGAGGARPRGRRCHDRLRRCALRGRHRIRLPRHVLAAVGGASARAGSFGTGRGLRSALRVGLGGALGAAGGFGQDLRDPRLGDQRSLHRQPFRGLASQGCGGRSSSTAEGKPAECRSRGSRRAAAAGGAG